MKLDHYDLILLDAVQQDAQQSQRALGDRAHLSTAAVNRRLKQLAKAGVIRRHTVELEPAALGWPLTIIVEVKVDSERAELLQQMQRTFRACPEIQQCYYVAGDYDFVLVLLARDMAQYVALTRRLFHADANVRRFRTLVVMDRVKTGADVPVLSRQELPR